MEAVLSSAHIQIDSLVHRYSRSGPLVLDGVSVEIAPGEAVALIGRSGCGKSTLLHAVAGLSRPTGGGVWIDGQRVVGPSPKWNMMFQQASLYPWLTAAENAALGLRFTGRARGASGKARELLAAVGLAEHADTNVQDLSGGQQQRVALARSLAVDPEILLLDEPFSALDAFTRADLQRDVRALARSRDITLVLVTHDIDEAVLMADRALVMGANPGRILRDLRFDLPDLRDRADPRVAAEKRRLVAAFAETAGLDGLEEIDDAPSGEAAGGAPVVALRAAFG